MTEELKSELEDEIYPCKWVTQHLSTFPNVYLDNWGDLPEVKGVYLVCHNYKVLYVGMTTEQNLRLRWSTHNKKKTFTDFQKRAGEPLTIRYIPLDNQQATFILGVEAQLIKVYQPHFNYRNTISPEMSEDLTKIVIKTTKEVVESCLEHFWAEANEVDDQMRASTESFMRSTSDFQRAILPVLELYHQEIKSLQSRLEKLEQSAPSVQVEDALSYLKNKIN